MKPLLPICCLLGALPVWGQESGIFAVTDRQAGGAGWNVIRSVDARSGSALTLLDNQAFEGTRIQASTRQAKAVQLQEGRAGADHPMTGGVAALAYDASNRRLYFSTMFGGQLNYIDLTSGQARHFYAVANLYDHLPRANNADISNTNQGPVITRMTMGADGYVYGLSNDGDLFFRVATRGKLANRVENLGALKDDPANAALSVHTGCSSWGGDMVAAENGDLYLFSMYQHVFRISTDKRVATYMGKLQGLPADFTVNGAAVDADGSVILSSSSVAGKLARVSDWESLRVTVHEQPGWLNASDLASPHRLFAAKSAPAVITSAPAEAPFRVDVYPNPVTNGQLMLRFGQGVTGRFAVDLLDNSGRPQMQANVLVSEREQRASFNTRRLAKGLYLLRVTDADSRQSHTVKVVLQ